MASTRKERRGDARRANVDDRAFDRPVIERYNSPKTKHTDENAPIVFSAALFVAVFLAVSAVGFAITGGIDIWIICLAIALAVLAIFTVRIAPQWERVVILRFGNYRCTAGICHGSEGLFAVEQILFKKYCLSIIVLFQAFSYCV